METGDNQRNFIKAKSKAPVDNTVGLHRSTHARGKQWKNKFPIEQNLNKTMIAYFRS